MSLANPRTTAEQHKNGRDAPTHGVARFLLEADPDTPVRELGDRYREWCEEKDAEQTEQSDLGVWSE